MNKVFVVKNQHGLYLNKQQEWVDGADRQALFRTQHRDEAINTVFEASSRDIYLRAEALACDVDAKNNPVVSTESSAAPSSQVDLLIEEPIKGALQVADGEVSDGTESEAPVENPVDEAASDVETPPENPHSSEQ